MNEELTKLLEITDKIDMVYGADFTDDDKILIKQIYINMKNDDVLSEKINNESEENVRTFFNRYFDDETTRNLESNFNFFKKINNNSLLKDMLKSVLLDSLYKYK